MAFPHPVAPGETTAAPALLREHGALLFRGFGLGSPEDFERLALLIDPNLQEVYRGTAPRSAKTRYVHSSTELGSMLPIPQHIEMSFLPAAPRRLFFYCRVPPRRHGETPIADFATVWRELDPDVREAFETRGVRHIRNYNPPGKRFDADLSKLKTWDRVYGTTDRAEIESRCRAEGQDCEFRPGGGLRLVNEGPAYRDHPVTGERVWFNHAQVFHPAGPVEEAARVARRQGGVRQQAFSWFLRGLHAATSMFLRDEDRGTQATYGDGEPIPGRVIRHLQEVIWNNMVFHTWRRGDMLAIDNFRVAHGRMPFSGPREIMVAWTD